MDEETYRRISAPLRNRSWGARLLACVDRAMVILVAAAYFTLIAYLLMTHDARLMRVLLVPALSFIAMSIARRIIDEPRPYEALDIEPLLAKDTKGRSFPGRHVFSAGVIGMALMYVNIWAGVGCLVVMAAIGCTRVVGGVHYPRDVIWGALLGVACGIVGFWVI